MAKRPRRPPVKPAPVVQPYRDLADYLARSGETQEQIADRVGTSQVHISRIAHGRAIPRPLLAMRIAQHCHIPLDSFLKMRIARQLDDHGDAA